MADVLTSARPGRADADADVDRASTSARSPELPVMPEEDVEAAVAPEPTGHSVHPAQHGPAMDQAPGASAPPGRTRRWKRTLLFLLLPIALAAGGYEYVVGGQVTSSDNAYIQAQTLGVSTDVSGIVAAVLVHNNEVVTKGQPLFRIEQDTFRIALAGAQAQLGTVRNQILTLRASYAEALAQLEQAKADLPYFQKSFEREQSLVATAAASRAIFDTAEHNLVAARQKVVVAATQVQAILAQLGGDPNQPTEQNPLFLQAKSAVDSAQRDLNQTEVRAAFDGVVTNVDALQVGSYLQASRPGFSLVSTTNLWIDVSPKETELTYVRPGQKAIISVDTYPGVEWSGVVESISPASGASFSLLPAQNTTGNWVKVVQRIPMRVRIEDLPGKPPLRVGMSAEVGVDTGHARGLPQFVTDLLDRTGLSRG